MAAPNKNGFRWKYVLPARRFAVRMASGAMWALSPRLTLWLVKHLFSVPPRAPLTAEQETLLRLGERFELTVRGRRVIGWKWGKGPMVLFVHGWGERGARFHGFVAPLVECGFSVVTFDQPAHGESGGRHTNFLDFVGTLKSVIANMEKPAAVVGYSMGGGAVVNLWESFDADTRIVLISPLYDVFSSFGSVFRKAGIAPPLGDGIFKALEKEHGVLMSSINPSVNALKVTGEVLLIHDEGDWMIPMAEVESMAKSFPRARLFRTTGLGHTRMLESPMVIDEALTFLLEGCAKTTRPPAPVL